ncbi:MAG: hypothetical protein AAF945_03855 [Actinomycetota bacterium]
MRGAVALSLGLGAVGVGALLARATSDSDTDPSTADPSTGDAAASGDVFTADPDDPAGSVVWTVPPVTPPSTATTDGAPDATTPTTAAPVTAAADTTAAPDAASPTTVPPSTVPPSTVPPFPDGGLCGPAPIAIGELIDASTQPHDRPIPVIPDHWSFALGPTADEGVGNPIPSGSRYMNPWNHIYEGAGTVEMGRVCVAVRQSGVWTVHDFGPMCIAVQTDDFGNWGGPDTGVCEGDIARYAVEPGVFTHGWPDSGWAEIVGGSGTVEYVLSWGSVRGEGSLYHCGIDRRNRGETGVITPMAHGRAFVVDSDWRSCIAHNMSEPQVLELCAAGELPPSFPLVGGCERS